MIEKTLLGSTSIEVSRIGISSSFGAESAVFHEAFERGCNYFTWGTFIKGRSSSFIDFFRQMSEKGKREQLFVGLLSYSHSAALGNMFLKSALRQLKTDYVDGLILGYYSKRPPGQILDWALEQKKKGVVRTIGMTTHNRKIVVPLIDEQILDFFHIRYNGVHRGAEQDIFPYLQAPRPGIVSFTATDWGKLLKQRTASGKAFLTAGDCYRFALARPEIDVCMMGVKNLKMLQENMRELEKGPMSAEEIENMSKIGDRLYGKPRAVALPGQPGSR